MKLIETVGATSRSHDIFIADSSSASGAGLTGLVYNSAGLTAYWNVPGTAPAAIALATLAANNSAWSSGGFKEIDATNRPGWYRFDIPDTVFASGRSTSIHLKGATNMAPLPIEFQLTTFDLQSARVDVGKVLGTAQTARDLGANLDATVSSRSTYAGGDTAGTTTLLARITAAAIAHLDADISSRSTYAGADTGGTTTLLARLTAIRAGLIDNLDAAISSRSTYAGGDTPGTTTLLARVTAAAIANLDAAVSTRLATSGYTAPDNADIITGLADLVTLLARVTGSVALNADVQTLLGRIDVVLSTRLAAAAYTAPDNAGIAEIAGDTDAIITGVGALPTANAIVTAVFARTFGANYQNKTFAQLQEAMAATLFGPTSGGGTTEEVFHDLTGGVKVTVDNNLTDRTATTLA